MHRGDEESALLFHRVTKKRRKQVPLLRLLASFSTALTATSDSS